MGYSIQGTLFYNTAFIPSMIYNSLVTFGSMAINFVLYIISIPAIVALKNKYLCKLV
jgi:putative membrane protein